METRENLSTDMQDQRAKNYKLSKFQKLDPNSIKNKRFGKTCTMNSSKIDKHMPGVRISPFYSPLVRRGHPVEIAEGRSDTNTGDVYGKIYTRLGKSGFY